MNDWLRNNTVCIFAFCNKLARHTLKFNPGYIQVFCCGYTSVYGCRVSWLSLKRIVTVTTNMGSGEALSEIFFGGGSLLLFFGGMVGWAHCYFFISCIYYKPAAASNCYFYYYSMKELFYCLKIQLQDHFVLPPPTLCLLYWSYICIKSKYYYVDFKDYFLCILVYFTLNYFFTKILKTEM